MKLRRVFNLALALFLIASGVNVQPAAAAQNSATPVNVVINRDSLFVPGEVVVGFASGQSAQAYAAQASALAGTVNAQVVDRSGSTALLSFAENADVVGLAQTLGAQSGVLYAEPNYISWIPETAPNGVSHDLTEITRRGADGKRKTISMAELKAMRTMRGALGVPTYPAEGNNGWAWGWWWSNANLIWPNYVAATPTVCVVDTGVDVNHPDLIGRALNGADFVNDDAIANDDNGHGTHVAGTIAAIANNKKGITGISNGKVLAVKVLSAAGWGTSFDVAAGITYCANNPYVKVINMSLGGSAASNDEYLALSYAINTKNKLVVVAAGNSGGSALEFPSAWAADWVCKDGTDNYPTSCASLADNTIQQGILSVGAARAPWGPPNIPNDANGDGLLWVDVNGDLTEPALPDTTEHFNPDMCATNFSTYGSLVEIVAPGEDIFSTQPVSYPFYNNYYYGSDWNLTGYEWYNGTSMATPHVAGAAARAWSVFPGDSNASMKTRLITSGVPLNAAADWNMVDPTAGYAPGNYSGEAPYCWPSSSMGAYYDMTNSVYLDVAAAMNRAGVSVAVTDAVTGLPLTGASVYAYQGATLKDTAKVAARDSRWADLINLPVGASLTIKVSKLGYTTPAIAPGVAIGSFTPSSSGWWWSPLFELGIPPLGRITGVANWPQSNTNLDLYAFLPANAPLGGGVVGAGNSWHPTMDRGVGDNSAYPFAHWNRNGGWGDWMGLESISIASRPGYPTMPYYNSTPLSYYDFMLSDYGSGDLNNVDLIFRVWRGGQPMVAVGPGTPYVWKGAVCDTAGLDTTLGTADDEVFWEPGYLNYGTFYAWDACGYADTYGAGGIWPYANGGSISKASGKPISKPAVK